MTQRYELIRSTSSAARFHERVVGDPAARELWWHDITAPALVLGSSQPETDVDHDACRAAGVEIVRRRSGGGAVLLIPGEVTWLDVIVPQGSAGWADDVHAPMRWLGRHLAAVLEPMGLGPVRVHEAGLSITSWSRLICFDGVGAGEVLLDGRKLIGMSQRRTRHASRLQCCWYSTYVPGALVDLLAAEQRPPIAQLAPVAVLEPSIAAAIPVALAERL